MISDLEVLRYWNGKLPKGWIGRKGNDELATMVSNDSEEFECRIELYRCMSGGRWGGGPYWTFVTRVIKT